MKKILTLLLTACLGLSLSAQVFTDASAFPVYGKVSDATKTRYQRLPADLEGVSRDAVWHLGTQSAGLYIRFRSNSTAIHARWTSTYGSWLSNMNPTGVRGLDLYILVDGVWRPAGVGRPSQEKTTTDCMVKNMTPEWREYMLYLSLYDGVDSLEVGVDEGASLEQPLAATPRTERPVVMYGTSILQGCSASRPGMAHTNMISRALDREVFNLGFSGNALLDLEIAHLMASVPDPAVYVLDYAPNAYAPMIKERGEEFFRILRDAHPDVPVIFIEDVIFPHTLFDSAIRKEVEDKNFEQKALFKRLKKQGHPRREDDRAGRRVHGRHDPPDGPGHAALRGPRASGHPQGPAQSAQIIAIFATNADSQRYGLGPAPEKERPADPRLAWNGLDYRADIVVYDRQARPLLVAECKRPEVELTQEVVDQAIRYNNALDVRYIVITNGLKTFMFERGSDGFVFVEKAPLWEDMLCRR